MKIKISLIIISVVTFCFNFKANSQSAADLALQFSQISAGGSARAQGIGGGFTALGGDVSAASSNPAGLGFYNRSEISFTPYLSFFNSEASYMGNSTTDFKSKFGFANFGIVFNNTKDDAKSGSWRGGSFAITYNKNNIFHKKFSYSGEMREKNTMVSYLLDEANYQYYEENLDPEEMSTLPYLAYSTELIFFDEDNGGFYTDIDTFPSTQRETVETQGYQSQWNFSYGGNFSDKLYLGASLGLSSIYWEQDSRYTELPSVGDLTRLLLSENLRIRATGVNFKAGLIYRPVTPLTLGVSFTTPTIYGIEDDYSASMNNDYIKTSISDNDNFKSEYNLRTPLRFSAGMAFFFNKNGFITGEVEYLDYTQNQISGDEDPAFNSKQNNDIKDFYKNSVVNFKVGGEYRVDILRFRLGYALQGNPYVNNDNFNVNGEIQTISGGVGFKFSDYFVDFGVVHSSYDSFRIPYLNAPMADIKNKATNVVATIGWNF